jgi:hypothetical protein
MENLKWIGCSFILWGVYLIYFYQDPDKQKIITLTQDLSVCRVENQKLKQHLVSLNQAAEQKKQIATVLKNLETNFNNSNPKSGYKSRVLPTRNLVSEVGSYYAIDLTHMQSQQVLYFQEGQFNIDQFDVGFGRSLGAFINDVQKLKEHHLNYKIYAWGSADSKGNQSRCFGNLPYNNDLSLRVHPPIANTQMFSEDLETVTIPRSCYNNQHLPNLRAYFISRKFEGSDLEVELLQGNVNPVESAAHRNATIYLYVEKWDQYQ